MRKILILSLFLLFSLVGIAQNNTRVVKGFVQNAEGRPLSGITVKAVDEDASVVSGQNGAFELRVSPYCRYIEASAEGYLPYQIEIDGSMAIFRLKADKKYAQMKAKQEAEAKAKAEAERIAAEKEAEAQRIAAEKEAEAQRIAAEKEAAAKAEAERRAQEQARIEAEKARIAAEKEAIAKAEAEYRAQEQARIEAEKARIAAEKEAIAKAEAERRAQEQARIEAEKAEKVRLAKIEAEKRRKLYAEKQSGFASIANLSYMVGMGGINPSIGINYIAGYRINNILYVGGGTGVNINLGAGPSVRGIAWSSYSETNILNPCLVSVPVFVYFRANFLNRRCSPFFALAAGGNFSGRQTLQLDLCDVMYKNMGIFVNPQLGVNFRTTTKTALYFAVGFKCLTTPACIEYTGYNATFKPSLGYGVDFHLGFTF